MKPATAPCRLAICVVVILAGCNADREAMPKESAEAAQVAEPADAAAGIAKAEVKTLEFNIRIDAPLARVWDTMLSPGGYSDWTAPFAEGSYFEGSWSEGERINFLAPGGSGMAAVIAVNRPYEFISIKHIGYIVNGVEDTTSDDVLRWAPAYENYRFTPVSGGTEVHIEQEVLAGYEAMMNDMWSRALARLEALCEAE